MEIIALEIGIGNWHWKLELEIGIGNWNWKLEFEIGNWICCIFIVWHSMMFELCFRKLAQSHVNCLWFGLICLHSSWLLFFSFRSIFSCQGLLKEALLEIMDIVATSKNVWVGGMGSKRSFQELLDHTAEYEVKDNTCLALFWDSLVAFSIFFRLDLFLISFFSIFRKTKVCHRRLCLGPHAVARRWPESS